MHASDDHPAAAPSPTDGPRPRVSRTLLTWFGAYSEWYVRRHFHTVRVSFAGSPPDPAFAGSRVVFVNHASWWDPLACLVLHRRLFPGWTGYAPIDAVALTKYRFFERLGFFGVEQGTRRGAARFLRVASDLVRTPQAMLWITPQGRFSDVRERPVRFREGLGHLARRCAQAHRAGAGAGAAATPPVEFLPVALEYTPWEERLPELLIRVGAPIPIPPGDPASSEAWTDRLEKSLEGTMDDLARLSLARESAAFAPLLAGKRGVGGTYDTWRRLRAAWSGRSLDLGHGRL